MASFLHARQARGRWLVRIEDIDPPREVPGAAAEILRTLEAFGLLWDEAPLYQSSRFAHYQRIIQRLLANGQAYRCSCTRRDLRPFGRRYPGTCRHRSRHLRRTAVRVRTDSVRTPHISWLDGLQGAVSDHIAETAGDYVIARRDGLPAYHLAVVVDDAYQGVTDIVRGVDLLDSTPIHIHLQRLLDLPTPRYFHLPVVVNKKGEKLSKQTGASALGSASRERSRASVSALRLLGLRVPPELLRARPPELWAWAAETWRIESLTGRRELACVLPP